MINIEPIIPTWIFYAISVASGLHTITYVILTCLIIAIATIVAISLFKTWIEEDFEIAKTAFKIVKKLIVPVIITAILFAFIPTEKTMYMMLTNTFITPNNIESVKYDAKELTDYVFDKIEKLNANGK